MANKKKKMGNANKEKVTDTKEYAVQSKFDLMCI